MSAYSDFLVDPLRLDVWIAELYPYNSATGLVVTLRVATDEYATEPSDAPANMPYEARLLEGPNFETDAVPPGTLGQLPARRGGELKIGQRFGDRDAWRAYDWDGRRVTVRHGGFSPRLGRRLAYAEMGVAEYEAETATFGLDVITVQLRDPVRRFEDALQSRRYMGTDAALAVTGASTYVSFGAVAGAAAKVNLTGDLTIEGWLWLDTLATAVIGPTWNTGGNYPFHTGVLTTGQLRWGSSNITALASTLTLSTKRRYHVQWVRQGATITYRVLEDATGVETIETATATAAGGASAVGSLAFGLPANPFRGITDDWRIYDYARTEDEWRDTRNRELTAAEAADTHLKLYLPFNGAGSSTTVADASASPANGTISGANFAWLPSLQGKSDLAGQVIPDAFGYVEDANPVLVHEPTRTYQCHSRTSGGSFVVSEGGGTIAAGTAYTDLLAFLLASTTAGQADTLNCTDGTYLRLGSNPSKPISVTFQGDATGSGYVSSAADITRRIVTSRGEDPLADPGELDTASYAALNAANSAVLGRYYREEVSIAQVLEEILGSVGAQGWFRTVDKKHKVKRFEGAAGVSVKTLTDRQILSLEPLVDLAPPVREQVLTYRHNYTTLTIDQMATGIITTARQAFLEKPVRTTPPRSRSSTRRRSKYARTDRADTYLTTLTDAVTEADRRLELHGQPARGYRLECSLVGGELDRGDIVTIYYTDLNAAGDEQTRLDLNGVQFVVLASGVRAAEGRALVTVWREN